MGDECVYCHGRYVNYLNYCLMCGRVQPKQRITATVTPRRGRRLTQEERNELIQDIQRGLESGELNMHELGRKYDVDHKTVVYWKKKLEAEVEQRVAS